MALGVVAAACISIALRWLFRPPMPSLFGELLPAVIGGYIAAVVIAAGLVAGASLLFQQTVQRRASFSVVIQVASEGVWIAVLVIAGFRSRLLVPAIIGLAFSLGSYFGGLWQTCYAGAAASIFRLEAHMIAVCLHAILAGELLRIPLLTVSAAGVTAFVITLLVAGGRAGLGLFQLTGSALIACLLLFLVLRPAASRIADGGGGPGQSLASAAAPKSKLHSGVILEPEHHRVTVLAPIPKVLEQNPLAARATKSALRIPFSGQYWFYYSRGPRPPADALLDHGDPLTWTLTGMDRLQPLVMKAHQPLHPPIPMSCCAGISVALEDRDPEPETTAVELLLLESQSVVSLGTKHLRGTPAKSVILFPIPENTGIRQFEALEVVFHLDRKRRNQSANVAIERFDLMTRGR